MPCHITGATVQAWGENYVQALTLLGGSQRDQTLIKLTSSKGKGEARTYDVEAGERIVGIYGYQDNKGDVRGIGFLTVKSF